MKYSIAELKEILNLNSKNAVIENMRKLGKEPIRERYKNENSRKVARCNLYDLDESDFEKIKIFKIKRNKEISKTLKEYWAKRRGK